MMPLKNLAPSPTTAATRSHHATESIPPTNVPSALSPATFARSDTPTHGAVNLITAGVTASHIPR